MKTNIFTVLLSLIISTSLYAQEPDFAWVKRIGDSSPASLGIKAPCVTVDKQGNSYVVGGYFGQSFILDGITLTSPIPLSATYKPCGYIAKYDLNGQIIWAKSTVHILGTMNNADKLLVDEHGNIYFCASGAIDGHCIINGYYLTDPTATFGAVANHYNMFLSKLDPDGNVLWVKKTSHPYNYPANLSTANEIHFDLGGNINMTGAFRDSILFAPGDMLTTNTGEAAVFLTKYSPAGDILQIKKLAGETYPQNQFGTEHVRADASGKLYRWSSRSINNPKRLYRYDAMGELLDSLNLTISTTSYYPELKGFAVSPAGDVFIGGAFFGTLTLEGTTYNGFGNSACDAVLFKLSAPNYEVDWVKTHRTVRSDSFEQLLADGLGNIYATGMYANAQEYASVLHKYTNDGDLIWGKLLTGLPTPQTPTTGFVVATSLCQSQNGGNIWVAGRFSTNAYFSPGDHFTTPNNNHYNGFLVQYGLCNTANPIINTPVTTTLCGEEIITLSANLSTPGLTYFWSTPSGTVAIGSSATTAELTITQPGKYYLVAQENAECYGKSQEIWVTQASLPDTSVIQQAATLTAVAGNTYQWLDCDNGLMAINGATGISFTPVQNGNYALEVTSPAGCMDTSSCFAIDNLSVTEQTDLAQLISIYPNPAKDEINIEGVTDIQAVRVLDLQGKELMVTTGDKVMVSILSSGVYLIEISTSKGVGVKKFLKE